MRCLHCGKDLPLLKRLSGGEFCSDAHRRDYQQEFSDLALTRLLQARPSAQPTEPPTAAPAESVVLSAPPPAVSAPIQNGHPVVTARVPSTPPLAASPRDR